MAVQTPRIAADKSPLKQGLYTPGTHIPVVPPERLLEDQPDYVVLLAWNFADEILEQQAEYRRRAGASSSPSRRFAWSSEPGRAGMRSHR